MTPADLDPTSGLMVLADRTERDWRLVLEHGTRIRRAAGEALWAQGEESRSLLLLFEGQVEESGSPAPVDAPAVLGVAGFFGAGRRDAALVAVRDVEGALLEPGDVERLAAEHPELARALLHDLGRTLSVRLALALRTLDERDEELRRLREVAARTAPIREEDEPDEK